MCIACAAVCTRNRFYRDVLHSAYPILTNTKVSVMEIDFLCAIWICGAWRCPQTTPSLRVASFVSFMVEVTMNCVTLRRFSCCELQQSINRPALAQVKRVSQGDALMLRHPVLGASPTV